MLMMLLALSMQAATQHSDGTHQAIAKGGQIAESPARDVGIAKTVIAPVLLRAAQNPYSTSGTASCAAIASGIRSLSAALGTDFSTRVAKRDDRVGHLAEAGGQSLVNGLVPFRSLVREVSGAASAERRRNAAISAGYARRGFLRGVAMARKCRTS